MFECNVRDDQACLWFLGQAGYFIKGSGVSILIDPYLSNSAGGGNPLFERRYPVPVAPSEICADIFIATHDHVDHLDPETIEAFKNRDTLFVAPRFAAKKLRALGVDDLRIRVVDQGERAELDGVTIAGVFALPTGADVLDTTGYLIEFPNGRTVYHTSDTAYADLLLSAAPRCEVLLTCINGKFGNLTVEQAAKLTRTIRPRYAIPNHYDVMPGNGENPYFFEYLLRGEEDVECHILSAKDCFIWGEV